VGREGNGRQPGLWVCERRRGKVLARARKGEKKVMGRRVTELPCGCVQGEEVGVSGNRASCGRELVLGGGIDKLTIGMELRREVGSFPWECHGIFTYFLSIHLVKELCSNPPLFA